MEGINEKDQTAPRSRIRDILWPRLPANMAYFADLGELDHIALQVLHQIVVEAVLLQELGIAGIQDIEKHYLSGPWDLRYIFQHLAGVPGGVGRNQNFFKHFLSPLAILYSGIVHESVFVKIYQNGDMS